MSGIKTIEKISHDFLIEALYEIGQPKGWSFYLLGGPEGTAEKATERIREKFPEVNIVGTHHSYFDSNRRKEYLKGN